MLLQIQNNHTTQQNRIAFKASSFKSVPFEQYLGDCVSKELNNKSTSKLKKFYMKYITWPLTKLSLKIQQKKLDKLDGHIILDNHNEKAGMVFYTFPNDSVMNIDYIKINKKVPRNFLDTSICIIQEILSTGRKKSVKVLSCEPINEKLERLYNKKFGFSRKKNKTDDNFMYVNFDFFTKIAENFIKQHS